MARSRNPRPPGAGEAALRADGTVRPILAGGERLLEKIKRASGGGGEPWHYRSVEEAHAHLAPQAQRMVSALRRLPRAARGPHVVIEATIQPSYLASSHYPEDLFRAVELYPVGTREAVGTYRTAKRPPREGEPTKTYLLAGDDNAINNLATLIARGPTDRRKRIWEQIREFEHIGLRATRGVLRGLPTDVVDEEVITWEAVLSELGTTKAERNEIGLATLEQFFRFVLAFGGEVDREYVRSVGGLTFLPVALSIGDARSVAQFNSLRVMRPMPRVADLDMLIRGSAMSPVIPRQTSEPNGAGVLSGPARVAVFDGGIDRVDTALQSLVHLHDLTPEPPDKRAVQHGTIVTNAILYGYAATGPVRPQPLVAVDHYRIVPAPQTTGILDRDFYWILDQIEARVTTDGHKLVNLSLGPPLSVDDDAEPHRWTATLDRLAATHGVLFVTAVGNNGMHPNNRIRVPADMANGLAVGACTSRDPSSRVTRAPYSAVGPGRAGQRIAPTGVSFGGVRGEEPFRGLGPGARVFEGEGTSYAAPLVTHGMAGLRAGLGGVPRSETLRAFAAHFATGVPDEDHDERHVGHGRLLESYEDVWRCTPNEVTLLYEVELERHGLIALPAPFPTGIPGHVMADVHYTVCYASHVQLGYAADYTRSGLITTFRPHARMFALYQVEPGEAPKVIDPRVDVKVDQAYVAKLAATRPIKLGQHPLSHAGTKRRRWEGDQRAGGKWETLARTSHRIRAKNLHAPRLDLEYLARDGSRLAHGTVPKLAVSVLVTVRVPPSIPLYELARAQFPVLSELRPQIAIPMAAPIRIRGRS